MGWICTNCGSKYGDPPYDIHSSWGCAKCCPHLYGDKSQDKKKIESDKDDGKYEADWDEERGKYR